MRTIDELYSGVDAGIANGVIVPYDEDIVEKLATSKCCDLEDRLNCKNRKFNHLLAAFNSPLIFGNSDLFSLLLACAFSHDVVLGCGIVLGKYTHYWLEDEDFVYDPLFLGKYPKDYWNRLFQPKCISRAFVSEDFLFQEISKSIQSVDNHSNFKFLRHFNWSGCSTDRAFVPINSSDAPRMTMNYLLPTFYFPQQEDEIEYLTFRDKLVRNYDHLVEKSSCTETDGFVQGVPSELLNKDFYDFVKSVCAYASTLGYRENVFDSTSDIARFLVEKRGMWEYFSLHADAEMAQFVGRNNYFLTTLLSLLCNFYKNHVGSLEKAPEKVKNS